MSLPPNFIARPYRGVSVQTWEGPLDPADVRRRLLEREAYRRTEFLVLRREGETVLLRITTGEGDALFKPITDVEWVAGPEDCVYVEAPSVDTGNATAMAKAALALPRPPLVTVIEGLYHHVNFVYAPRPLRIRVPEVIPPEPAKLLDMAQAVVAFDEDLPPVDLVLEPIDIRHLAALHPSPRYLLPCRGSGIDLPAPFDFLDERPPFQDGWTLIGCERSRQIYEWFYASQPRRVELCPRVLDSGDGPALIKCCLLERGLEQDGDRLVVPWGASLKEVQEALHRLAGTAPNLAPAGASTSE